MKRVSVILAIIGLIVVAVFLATPAIAQEGAENPDGATFMYMPLMERANILFIRGTKCSECYIAAQPVVMAEMFCSYGEPIAVAYKSSDGTSEILQVGPGLPVTRLFKSQISEATDPELVGDCFSNADLQPWWFIVQLVKGNNPDNPHNYTFTVLGENH